MSVWQLYLLQMTRLQMTRLQKTRLQKTRWQKTRLQKTRWQTQRMADVNFADEKSRMNVKEIWRFKDKLPSYLNILFISVQSIRYDIIIVNLSWEITIIINTNNPVLSDISLTLQTSPQYPIVASHCSSHIWTMILLLLSPLLSSVIADPTLIQTPLGAVKVIPDCTVCVDNITMLG